SRLQDHLADADEEVSGEVAESIASRDERISDISAGLNQGAGERRDRRRQAAADLLGEAASFLLGRRQDVADLDGGQFQLRQSLIDIQELGEVRFVVGDELLEFFHLLQDAVFQVGFDLGGLVGGLLLRQQAEFLPGTDQVQLSLAGVEKRLQV